tara:strand:- start:436 stop:951 length:516 start_codon:yes stop_codon:yes gene_type:complete
MRKANNIDLETTAQLFQIVEDKQVLKTHKTVNQLEHGNWMSFELFLDDYDGCFSRVSDWVRFANRIDNDGVSEYLTWISKSNKLKIKQGYCTIVRESKWSDEATLIFDEPIEVVVGEVNDEYIVDKVNKITGRFSYEWLWMKNGRQDKIANGIEIYFDCQKYELIQPSKNI